MAAGRTVSSRAALGYVRTAMVWSFLLACAPLAPEAREDALEGGRTLAPCDWPSVGAIEVNCTATLIGPRWILSAAHCPDGPRFRVWTGTSYLEPAIRRCIRHPDYDASAPVGSDRRVFDLMLCELDAAISAPVVPLLSACEAAELESPPHRLPLSTQVVVVGLGLPSFGSKRATDMEPAPFVLRRPLIPLSDPTRSGGPRPGDSGGPTFLRMRDGTWRQIGVHQGGVDWSATDVFVADAIDWIESTSGLDTTPCHVGSVWMPSAACAELASSLEGLGGAFPACTVEQHAPSPTCLGALDAGAAVFDGGVFDGGNPFDARDSDLDADTRTDGSSALNADAADGPVEAAPPTLDASFGTDGGAATSLAGCGCSFGARAPRPVYALILLLAAMAIRAKTLVAR